MQPRTQAEALLQGDVSLARALARGLLRPLCNNFVERPWGGMRIRSYKGLCPLPDQPRLTGLGLGEAFEIAACDDDPEARAHASWLRLADGSRVRLADLLRAHAETLLGARFAAVHGAQFPLLPKTLDIKELLSVQGHPPGNTEAYVIIEADPGATIRLGFRADIEPQALVRELQGGRLRQQELLGSLDPRIDQHALNHALARWFAARTAPVGDLEPTLAPKLAQKARWPRVSGLLEELRRLYWRVLDAMNAIPVRAGQVLYNANPPRIAAGRPASAEVHALGNPEGREILLLEIRRPGPTLRAWDNVRFPLREIDPQAALEVLNPLRTAPEEFIVEPERVRRGVFLSVDSEHFRMEHLRPAPDATVQIESESPHALHAIAGQVSIEGEAGSLGVLRRGESAVVPVGVRAYRISASAPAEIVKVSLPERD